MQDLPASGGPRSERSRSGARHPASVLECDRRATAAADRGVTDFPAFVLHPRRPVAPVPWILPPCAAFLSWNAASPDCRASLSLTTLALRPHDIVIADLVRARIASC